MKKLLLVVMLVCLSVTYAYANVVVHKSRSKDICVGEQRKILQASTKVKWWHVFNYGRDDRNAWWYTRSDIATLYLEQTESMVAAKCKKAGTDYFNISWEYSFNDPTLHQITYNIRCLVCVHKSARSALRKARRIIQKGIDALENEELSEYQKKKIVKEIERAKKLLKKALRNKKISKLKKVQIQKLIERLDDLINDLLEGMDYFETIELVEGYLNNLLKAVVFTPITPIGPVEPTPIRDI